MEPEVHPAARRPQDLLAECDVRRLRRSGPGGQHRNKVETAVQLRHRPTGVSAEANERRSQAANQRVAVERLRMTLALEVRLVRQASPSPLWRSRTAGGRFTVGAAHADFPSLLAEALDVIQTCQSDVKRAAAALGCAASQLVRLLRKEPRALMLVNAWRSDRGLSPLR